MSNQYDVFDVVCPYCGETSFGILLKPNTTHRIICPKCKQATYVKVLEDLSIQIYREDELCPECKGTGYATCPKCGGEGYLVMAREYGDDYSIYRLTEPKIRYIYDGVIMGCPLCGGKGSVKIHEEYHTEVIEKLNKASITRGTGKVLCPKCGGKGFIPSKQQDTQDKA